MNLLGFMGPNLEFHFIFVFNLKILKYMNFKEFVLSPLVSLELFCVSLRISNFL